MSKARVYIGVGTGVAAAVVLAFVFFPLSQGPAQPSLPNVMNPERPISEGEAPFSIGVALSKESPVLGEEVEITATVKSQTSPHTRAAVLFFIDGEKVDEISGVIPPFQTGSTSYTWIASAGKHIVRVEVASVAGVTYDSWERSIEVPEK